jgi:hypothetical protein
MFPGPKSLRTSSLDSSRSGLVTWIVKWLSISTCSEFLHAIGVVFPDPIAASGTQRRDFSHFCARLVPFCSADEHNTRQHHLTTQGSAVRTRHRPQQKS